MKVVQVDKNGKKIGIMCIVLGVFIYAVFMDSDLYMFFESTFLYTIISTFLPLFLVIFGIKKIVDSKKLYVAICPACNHKFGFPVNELSVQCPRCNKRVIKDGDEFKISP